jgi:hypothetical protein
MRGQDTAGVPKQPCDRLETAGAQDRLTEAQHLSGVRRRFDCGMRLL